MCDVYVKLWLESSAEEVFAALTHSGLLTQWFAEGASISLEEKKYDFWGRHTPGAPGKGEGSHKIVELDPNKVLAFVWHLRGAETRVEYKVSSSGSGCELALSHSKLPHLSPHKSSLTDFWTCALEGLRYWLQHGNKLEMPDYSKKVKGDVSLDLHIAAHPHDVFLGLIDPTQMNRWIARDAKVEPNPGGIIDFGWGQGPVKILEIEPDQKLSYTWKWEDEAPSVTTWTLEDSDGGTRLTVMQSGFAPERDSEDYYIGWHKYIHRLKVMLETGAEWSAAKVERSDVKLAG